MESKLASVAKALFVEVLALTIFLFFILITWPLGLLEAVLLFFCYVCLLQFFYLHQRMKHYGYMLQKFEKSLLQLERLLHLTQRKMEASQASILKVQDEHQAQEQKFESIARALSEGMGMQQEVVTAQTKALSALHDILEDEHQKTSAVEQKVSTFPKELRRIIRTQNSAKKETQKLKASLGKISKGVKASEKSIIQKIKKLI